MDTLLEGFPAIVYSGLWALKIYRRLEKTFPKPIKVIIFITDNPPAFSVEIENGNFELKILNEVNDPQDLDGLECDGYIALPNDILYGGIEGIRNGIGEGTVKLKNLTETLTLLGNLFGRFS